MVGLYFSKGELVDNQTTFYLLLPDSYHELIDFTGRICLLNLKDFCAFYLLDQGNATLSKHSLKRCFLPEMLYFHTLAVLNYMGTIKKPENGNKVLNDYLINLS
jgi:hypothetical protein